MSSGSCPFQHVGEDQQEELAQFAFAPFDGPLGDINREFHRAYEEMVRQVATTLGTDTPLLVVTANEATLLVNGERSCKLYVPEDYHNLKAVCHLAFGLQLTLSAAGEGPLSVDLTAQLRDQLTRVENVTGCLLEDGLPVEAGDAPERVLTSCRSHIDTVLREGAVRLDDVSSFAREVAEPLMYNAAVAALHELDGLHEVVSAWRNTLTAAEWSKLYVVVCGGHQSRYQQLAKQYFHRLLGEAEGCGAEQERRVLYGEGLQDVDAALDLLARHLIDQRSATIFFDEKDRLQRDLLADAAAVYLKTLLPAEEKQHGPNPTTDDALHAGLAVFDHESN